MSFVARPTIPAPKASYVEGLRAKEREGKKTTARAAAAAAPQQPFKTALVLNGGGLLPVASAYGIFRGLHKVCVGPNGDKPALDEFDVMAGASLLPRLGLTAPHISPSHPLPGVSGGYLASQTYCYANPEPTGFNNFDKPCPKLDPVNFLNTSANSDPNSITWDDLLTDNSKACGDKPETGYYNWMVRRQGGLNPGLISGAIMSLPFGFVARILSFGKCVGRGCWPKYGWLCLPSFSIGFASWARMFFSNFFLSPLGISQNKYTASGPDQVSDVACAAGVEECEVAYPRPGAPTPMAHSQVIQVRSARSPQPLPPPPPSRPLTLLEPAAAAVRSQASATATSSARSPPGPARCLRLSTTPKTTRRRQWRRRRRRRRRRAWASASTRR